LFGNLTDHVLQSSWEATHVPRQTSKQNVSVLRPSPLAGVTDLSRILLRVGVTLFCRAP